MSYLVVMTVRISEIQVVAHTHTHILVRNQVHVTRQAVAVLQAVLVINDFLSWIKRDLFLAFIVFQRVLFP